MVLDEVFRRLNKEGIEVILDDSEPKGVYCRYGTDVIKTTIENVDIVPEYLEVGIPDEKIIIEYHGDKPTNVTYSGKDIHSMYQRLKNLRLSNSSNNLGEGVLSRFRFKLEVAIEENNMGNATLTQLIIAGKEKHFVFILNKLLNLYKESMQPQS